MISMRNSRFWVLIAFCWLVSDSCEGGALTVKGPKCGTLYCKSDQFCSKHEMQCESCSDHCNTTHRNYDEGLCITGCQDFLHDVRYARSNHGADEFSRLQKQLNLVLVLLAVVLAILIVSHSIRLAKWCRGRGFFSRLMRKMKLKKPSKSEKMAPQDLTHVNPNTQSPKLRLRDPMRVAEHQANRESTVFSIGGASTIQTVSTPISTRYPAEDSTLSYSYDNAGLAITPTIPERPKTNSSGPF